MVIVSWKLDYGGWEIRKGDQEKNNDCTDHIHQHENSTIVTGHKPEEHIESNKMTCLAEAILWSRDMDCNSCPDSMHLRCGYIAAEY